MHGSNILSDVEFAFGCGLRGASMSCSWFVPLISALLVWLDWMVERFAGLILARYESEIG
jgi:hypothetical protein